MVDQLSRPGLTISQVAAATGVSATTLRAWESRHGFPVVARERGRHRRYAAGAVDDVRRVLALRADGLTLDAAIGRVRAAVHPTDRTVFAAVRRLHPELPVQTLTKRTLLALSHAIENECCARASSPHLYAGFQRHRFLDSSASRWRELARTAEVAVVAATGVGDADRRTSLQVVEIPEDSPLAREWSVVCHAPDHSAALAAWELPGQEGVADGRRRFEAVWSLDPAVVADAAVAAHRLLGGLGVADVPAPPPARLPDARESAAWGLAASVLLRALAEVDTAH